MACTQIADSGILICNFGNWHPSLTLPPVEPVRRAVIDVGTNSIKLLVADVDGHEVRPVLEQSKQTRLGRGFYETRRLQDQAITDTAGAVAEFADTARHHNAVSVRVFATSAARDAQNPEELIDAIRKLSGLRAEIITGEREAAWVFQGVTTDPALAREPLLLLDVGGGSTEFIVGQGEQKHFSASFPLGTVRLLEKLPHSDPPTAAELTGCRQWIRVFLQKEVRPQIEPAIENALKQISGGEGRDRLKLVGTGGTATILARMEAELTTYDRERIEAVRLRLARLRWHVEHLWNLPLEKRKQLVGLPPNRADVILTGAAVYDAILDEFGFEELRISTRGLRFAAAMME
jgi:exopolyphosphatase/guanosine-5'-triphosphate,3'-diphosphate pyrophosphatase